MALYPLLLTPIYKEKVWGGRNLERLGRDLPGGSDTLIGESWEVADLASTSPSGGGGAAALSVVRNGPLVKRTLGAVIEDFGTLVTGSLALRSDGSFPLLLKYLDARENLSVQVHPSADWVADHPEADLKSEAWYVVHAEPGAVLYKGMRPGVGPDELRAAIEEGTVESVIEAVPAVRGSCHYLPSGTCHALGAGILVAEIQTASDTGFRVFDWGRTGRELHVEDAIACIDFAPWSGSDFEPGTRERRGPATGRLLVACEHFTIREWTVPAGRALEFVSDELAVLMVIAGAAVLRWGETEERTLTVGGADTVLLPAALSSVALDAQDDVTLLEVTGPEEIT